MSAPEVQADLQHEALRLLASTEAAGVDARLLGGMAIRLLLGDALHPAFLRDIDDLDLIVGRRSSRDLERLLVVEGWQAEQQFNALNGARRMLFHDAATGHKVDVFVEEFSMCHTLPLADRLTVRPQTLPAADLLMTKLQIVELNAKDRGDLYALLLGCEVSDREGDNGRAVDVTRITDVASHDWGAQHTFELNLELLAAGVGEVGLDPSEQARVASRVVSVGSALEDAPKSRGWRMRARIGERKRWYEEVEEIDRD